jgi:cyclopropane fatty-acyl-phospholipid synthase-like methyltransferase
MCNSTKDYYEGLKNATGLVGLFSGFQLHPPMVDIPELWEPANWKRGVEESTRQLLKMMDLKPGSTVLDVGCGVGGVALQAAQEFGVRVVGISNVKKQMETARALHENFGVNGNEFIEADARSFVDDGLIQPNQFDAAICINMAYHISDRKKMFEQISAAVKKGGKLGLDDWVTTEKTTEEEYRTLRWKWSTLSQEIGFGTLADYKNALQDASWGIENYLDLTDVGKKYFANEQMYVDFKNRFLQGSIDLYGEYGESAIDTMIEDFKYNAMLYQQDSFGYFQLVAINEKN